MLGSGMEAQAHEGVGMHAQQGMRPTWAWDSFPSPCPFRNCALAIARA